ncbi:hypothetical protein [Jannaschia marina]|uniref:hypothetical protein n=1 Tax=Jannaschia marina TaxID=2741674 RepID=UPI0015CDE8E1|nr:hypothetical protein [Jannaschia marina]
MIRATLLLLAFAAPAAAEVCGMTPDAALETLSGDWAARLTPEFAMRDGAVVEELGDGGTALATIARDGERGAALRIPFPGGTAEVRLTPATGTAMLGPLPPVLTDTLADTRIADISGCAAADVPAFDLDFTRDFPDGRSGTIDGRLLLTGPGSATALQVITLYDPERGAARLVSRFDLTR